MSDTPRWRHDHCKPARTSAITLTTSCADASTNNSTCAAVMSWRGTKARAVGLNSTYRCRFSHDNAARFPEGASPFAGHFRCCATWARWIKFWFAKLPHPCPSRAGVPRGFRDPCLLRSAVGCLSLAPSGECVPLDFGHGALCVTHWLHVCRASACSHHVTIQHSQRHRTRNTPTSYCVHLTRTLADFGATTCVLEVARRQLTQHGCCVRGAHAPVGHSPY